MFSFLKKSISRQLSISIGVSLFVLLVLCGLLIAFNVNKGFSSVSESYLDSTASHYAESTGKILSVEYSICSTLQTALEQYEALPVRSRRSFINDLLRETLVDNESLVDAWTVWEPDALDGLDDEFANTENHDETGRFIPYWTRVGSLIECTALTDYVGGSWYEDPLRSPVGILIDPNPYEVGGQTIWVCGVAFPVRNKAGKAVGVVGIDMSLSTLSDMLKSAVLYDTGYLSLISATGLKAVDYDESEEGQIDSEFSGGSTSALFAEGARTLKSFQYESERNGVRLIKRVVPLKVQIAREIWYLGVNVPVAEVQKSSMIIMRFIVSSFVITLIVTIVLAYFIIRSMIREMNKGVLAMRNIAQGDGDLTVRMEVLSENELGKMYTYFNQTMEKIQNSLRTVKDSSENLQQQSGNLENNISDTAAAANQITSNVESVNRQIRQQENGVRETTDSLSKISTVVDSLTDSINKQSSSVNQSSSAIEEMVANIRSVTEILNKNTDSIKQLEKSSETGRVNVEGTVAATMKIKEQSELLLDASDVIQNIAEQTNLLAMNAAIEAAHAGEAGKGFSVVADEIRKLAEDSNAQGKSITENLKEVISSIEEVSTSTVAVQNVFNEIYNLSQRVAQQELTILSAMQEQSEGGNQVLEAIKEIKDISVNVNRGSSDMQKETDAVNAQMDSLMRLTEEITASMEEMSLGLESINKAINQVNDLTHKNRENIVELGSAVGKFRV